MNDLSGRIIRKSLNGSSESTLRRFIGNEEGTRIYRVKKEGERRGRKNTNCLRGWPERIYALPRRYISRDTRHRSHLVLSPVECSGSTPFPISPSSTEFCLVMYLNHNGDDECITFPGIFFFPFFPLSLPLVLLIQRVFHANSSLRYLFRGGECSPPSFLYL